MFLPCSRNKIQSCGACDLRVCAGQMARCHIIYIWQFLIFLMIAFMMGGDPAQGRHAGPPPPTRTKKIIESTITNIESIFVYSTLIVFIVPLIFYSTPNLYFL